MRLRDNARVLIVNLDINYSKKLLDISKTLNNNTISLSNLRRRSSKGIALRSYILGKKKSWFSPVAGALKSWFISPPKRMK
jgi:hypothetical protein